MTALDGVGLAGLLQPVAAVGVIGLEEAVAGAAVIQPLRLHHRLLDQPRQQAEHIASSLLRANGLRGTERMY